MKKSTEDRIRGKIADSSLGRMLITWQEKRVWEGYIKYCEKTAKDTVEEKAVEKDIKRLRYMLDMYDETKDPRGNMAMAARISVACLAADMPYENTPKSLKSSLDMVSNRKVIESEKKVDKIGIAVLAAIGGTTAIVGPAFAVMACVVAKLGKYIIKHYPNHTDKEYRALTGAMQKSYLDINKEFLPEGFEDMVSEGYCKISSDGRILVADDPNVAITVAECFKEAFEGTDTLQEVNDGKMSPKQLEKLLNDSFGEKILAGTGKVKMTSVAEDLSNEFAGNDLNEFVRTGMIRQKEKQPEREIGA